MATRTLFWLSLCVLAAIPAAAQTNAQEVSPILEEQILPTAVATLQLRDYVVQRVPELPETQNGNQWTETARQQREQILRDVVFHGWPEAWTKSPPKFEEVGVLPGKGYRIRKLRYEIVPGFQGAALLYEPENLSGRVPAVLNVNGHGEEGKALEYKQKRCITFAQNGIIALNLEWPYFGEMRLEGNQHIFGAHLDLAGANGVGFFYLAMRRGLDYLDAHPNVDRGQLGMTGLSGGGWQTIMLSALDERVRVSIPVAGFTSTISRVEDYRFGDLGDFEQNASDLFQGRDYPLLVAMRAPRPTKLIYNAEDSCCFRGPLAKPFVYDAVRRFYGLYGKEQALAWYENRDPGTHNYLLDNRRQAYRFFAEQFGLAKLEETADVGFEVRSGEELTVGVPNDNLTILDLARQLAAQIERPPLPEAQAGRNAAKERLRQVIRLEPDPIDRVRTIAMTKHRGVESRSHIFAMERGLSADGVWLQPLEGPEVPPITIVLDDRGRAESAAVVADRINRGEQVLAVDLAFTGSAWTEADVWMLQQVVVTQGDRPLGIRVAQLLSLAKWMRERGTGVPMRIEASGIRSQVAALTAAALEPGLFEEIVVRDGMESLRHLYDEAITFADAPDLFCLDLYKETDISRLVSLAAPTNVRSVQTAE